MAKKTEQIKESLEDYADYFKEINEIYDECLKKTKKMAASTEQKIDDLSQYSVTTKGTQMQLAEHTANEIGLLNQMQSLAESKYKLKKQILDYAMKDVSGDDEEEASMAKELSDFIKAEKEKALKHQEAIDTLLSEDGLDEEIDKILNEENN